MLGLGADSHSHHILNRCSRTGVQVLVSGVASYTDFVHGREHMGVGVPGKIWLKPKVGSS